MQLFWKRTLLWMTQSFLIRPTAPPNKRLPGASLLASFLLLPYSSVSRFGQPFPELAEYLTITSEPGTPPYELRLKVGSLCCLMRNLSGDSGLVKNARVIIRSLNSSIVEVETLPSEANSYSPGRFLLPRINFEFQPKGCSWTVQRRQFPLRLAYATTFNSCQGLTLDRAVLDIRVPTFAHGQLYTALSRVRCREHLAFFTDFSGKREDIRVPNIVYADLLL